MLDVTEYDITETLDTSGLSCPLPVLKAKKALKKLDVGSILKIISTDAGSKKDIASWSRVTGQELLQSDEGDGKFIFLVKRLK
ncbi:MAG: sulfurtransferase TusA family protein [Candidatus Kariarchaeaceae archaeon]